ncbi:C4-dicarboxylate ABC transporter [Bifidobacterium goeldii]|uniref:C4-dicarboxylate ABC transporter n=1 Tax=Bifidobacterium goeldii TaxID=2306975 RepID=A0A430FLM9_9BIFI|nr:C4-dicarboxylate ABC transporter [Bifidobacterium goeldii]
MILTLTDVLPFALWVFAVIWMLIVCAICIVRCRFGTGEKHPEVELVSWNVIIAQVVSVLLAGIPFITFILLGEEITPAVHAFYTQHLVIGSATVIVLVFVELMLMYVQARRADITLIERKLRGALR